ncbi:MAG: M15 family metallopeptidase [Microcoleaceae cyanobacterium]
MKPYQSIPIEDCGEPLVPIPLDQFAVESPHPYEKLGAPYTLSPADSPYFLRQSVLARLINAQAGLNADCPGWKISIFDAYRPIEVQQFMVNYTFKELLQNQGLNPQDLSEEQHRILMDKVYQFWAIPSLDPATPPPHSTGAAVDITLTNARGIPIEMGSPIDEISPRSFPDHFSQSSDFQEQVYHQNRQYLAQIMGAAGFRQHPNEWWHFSYGDQLWAWLICQDPNSLPPAIARYGRWLQGSI